MTRHKKYLHLPSRAENFCQNAGLKLTLFVWLGRGTEKDPGGTEPLSCNVSSVFSKGLSINDVMGLLYKLEELRWSVRSDFNQGQSWW